MKVLAAVEQVYITNIDKEIKDLKDAPNNLNT